MDHDHDLSPLEACPFCSEPVWLDIVHGEVDWRPCCEAMRAEVERYGFEGAYGMSLRDALIYEVGADPEEVREVFGAGIHDPKDPLDEDYYSDTTHVRYPLGEQVPMQLVQGKRGKPAFSGPQGWQQSVFESVEQYHSHHHAPQGWKFGVAVNNGPRRVGVAVVSNPVSRLLMQQEPDTFEVTRVCVWGHPKLRRNAVSKLYAICAREAKKLGASKLITYTLESEGAGSLIASGWTPVALSGGGAWDRPGRKREGRGKVEEYTSPKVRWEKVLDPRRAVALPRIELPKKAQQHVDDPPPQATPTEVAELKSVPIEVVAETASSPPPPAPAPTPTSSAKKARGKAFSVAAFCKAYYDERGLTDPTFDPDACTEAALEEATRQGVTLVQDAVAKTANKAFYKALEAF
jgi:hypothetical protein